jgi:hypothetical protein
MNAGTFGMADGRGMAGRKLATQVRSSTSATVYGNYVSSFPTAVINAGATYQSAASVSGGVETRIFSINGRGALRWLGAGDGVASNTIKVRLVIDGVTVSTGSQSGKDSTGGLVVCGTGNTTTGTILSLWDYMPFDSSVELFYTTSATAAPYLGFVVDIHQ